MLTGSEQSSKKAKSSRKKTTMKVMMYHLQFFHMTCLKDFQGEDNQKKDVAGRLQTTVTKKSANAEQTKFVLQSMAVVIQILSLLYHAPSQFSVFLFFSYVILKSPILSLQYHAHQLVLCSSIFLLCNTERKLVLCAAVDFNKVIFKSLCAARAVLLLA